MRVRSYQQFCALARTLDVVGDRWCLLILRNLLLGPQRWSELRANLPGIAKNLLSQRLTSLEEAGVLTHQDEVYALSPKGAELEPALFALANWGERHLMSPPEEGEAMRLRYFMTSVKRRLGATGYVGSVQLYVEGEPFLISLGPKPSVRQGEGEAEGTLRGGGMALRGLLLGLPMVKLPPIGATYEGERAALEALARALRRGSP